MPGTILLTLGVLLLLGNMLHLTLELLVLGMGVVLLVGRYQMRRINLAIPAMLFVAVGAALSLRNAFSFGPAQDAGWFCLLLGTGFGGIYATRGIRRAYWPLFPAAILAIAGLALLVTPEQARVQILSIWFGLVRWWPILLVLLGVFTLVRPGLSYGGRRRAVIAIAVVTLAYVVLVAAAWAYRGSLDLTLPTIGA
jgi:hypothetical protein